MTGPRRFKDDIPPEEYKTWQPRKLMSVLLDIDPSIGMTSTIAFGLEEEYGKPPPPEKIALLGTDHVFTLANLKTHYAPSVLTSTCHLLSMCKHGKCRIRRSCGSVATQLSVSSSRS